MSFWEKLILWTLIAILLCFMFVNYILDGAKIIRNVLTEMENEKRQHAEEKRKRNIELNKALEQNEQNRKNLKLLQERQKE